MAVQILNDMPDAAVNRGEPRSLKGGLMGALAPLRPSPSVAWFGGRAGFVVCTIAFHVVVLGAFLGARHHTRLINQAEPIMASIIEAPRTVEAPQDYAPPLRNLVYSLQAPPEVVFESESITPPPVSAAISAPAPLSVAPPMVESVEYVRPPAPVYPTESSRKRERGTVILRVLVDTTGHPADIRIERSSGYNRLDVAARDAVRKALFRPHEINGVAHPAQVLIPIEFTRRAT